MKKLGKVIVGSALLGAAAYGAHVYLNRLEQEEDIFEPDAAEDGAAAPSYTELEEAAGRAYTTIQHSSRQAMEKVREVVGPKGGEVMDEIGAAAKEMGKTVMNSADRIMDILQSKDEEAEAVEPEEAEEPAAEDAPATEPEEASPYVVLKSVKAAATEESSRTEEAAAAQARELAKAADELKIEEFFDDEDETEARAGAAE